MFATAVVVFALPYGSGSRSGYSAMSVPAKTNNPVSVAPETGFGGYFWNGKVTQISAHLLVPRILSNTLVGEAATWIGAQNPFGGPFIQIGILEDVPRSDVTSYEAFWSDTKVKFDPEKLGRVYPGDQIYVSMTRNSRGWTLKFSDPTISLAIKKVVRYGLGASFDQGEWLQEDPTPTLVAAHDVRYPDVANVTFKKLLVDGHAPTLKLQDGQTLSATGGVLRVPSRVRHDSFTFYKPKGAAYRYLVDARIVDFAENRFNAEFVKWRKASRSSKARDVKAFIDAYRSAASKIRVQSWPTKTHPDIAKLVKQFKADVENLQGWKASGYTKANFGVTNFEDGAYQDERLVDKLRAMLNLPPA